MSQPEWKNIETTDSYIVQVDKTGVYEAEMEYADEVGEDRFEVFRFSLERKKVVEVEESLYLVPFAYDETWPHGVPAYREWFAKDLAEVAESIGMELKVLREMFCSEDPLVRAQGYVTLGLYHGFANLDSYPLTLTEEELSARWEKAAE